MDKNDKPGTKLYKVKVHRANVEPENASLPITVNPIGPPSLGGKRTFAPGTVVKLTECQIGILKQPVETEFPIPEGSGIYEERNPIEAARLQYPDFEFKRDRVNGRLIAFKSTPNYFVEYLEGVPA